MQQFNALPSEGTLIQARIDQFLAPDPDPTVVNQTTFANVVQEMLLSRIDPAKWFMGSAVSFSPFPGREKDTYDTGAQGGTLIFLALLMLIRQWPRGKLFPLAFRASPSDAITIRQMGVGDCDDMALLRSWIRIAFALRSSKCGTVIGCTTGKDHIQTLGAYVSIRNSSSVDVTLTHLCSLPVFAGMLIVQNVINVVSLVPLPSSQSILT